MTNDQRMVPVGILEWAAVFYEMHGATARASALRDIINGPGVEPVAETTLMEQMLEWRGINFACGEAPCNACGGSGIRVYGSTSTWRGGVGGQAMTHDVCDKCWGSGRDKYPWPSHRRLAAAPSAPVQAVPDGVVLVPKEPTEKMIRAGWGVTHAAFMDRDKADPRHVYIRMLEAAAPQPPKTVCSKCNSPSLCEDNGRACDEHAPQRPLSSDGGESTAQSVACPTDKEKCECEH